MIPQLPLGGFQAQGQMDKVESKRSLLTFAIELNGSNDSCFDAGNH